MTKLKILLEQVLKERITDKVYHITTIENALNILQSDSFKASKVYAKDKEKEINPEGYDYYMSTARVRNSIYIRDHASSFSEVMFVLDGDKLNQNFKGKAVNYHAGSSHSPTRRYSEDEDRVFLRKPFIKNFSKYIKRVDIFIKESTNSNNINWIAARKIILQCKKYSIDYLIFNKRGDFVKGDKKLSIPFEDVKGYMKGGLPKRRSFLYTLDRKEKQYVTSFIFLYYSKSLYDFYVKNKTKGYPSIFPSNNFKPEELKKWVSDPNNKADFLSSLVRVLDESGDITGFSFFFNARNKDNTHQRISDVIEKIFRTERVRSLDDKLESKIINKWKDILDNYIEK